jgi:cation transport regulator ChaB
MIDAGNYMNLVLSLLLSKVIVPSEFHEQATIVEQMISKDTTGLVDSLTQFKADCATVDIIIDSESDKLDEIINEKWLPNINSEFRGKGIEVGLRGLMKEYHKEVWRGATFPILKILRWEKIEGINFPVSMTFVDGGSVYAEDKDKSETVDLFNYNYFLGKDKKEKIQGAAYFMYKPFVRWHTKYPVPYLIRRGIYKNWKIVDMIKDKEIELVDRIIPYMMLVLKGTEQLTMNNITYSTPDLEAVKTKIQEMMDKLNTVTINDQHEIVGKTPTRVTNFDEEIKHLIPDLEDMFKRELFAQAEKNILAGLGFIDIADAISTSRRESVLNPKVFIKECNTGVADFKVIVKDLLDLIKEKNVSSIKYNAKKWIIASNPITDFSTDTFKELIRSLSDRGLISNDTTINICGESTVNYELEKRKRTAEVKEGDEILMYPKITQNQEDKGTDIQGQKPVAPVVDKTKKVPEDRKKGSPEAKNWTQMKLEGDEEIDESLVIAEDEELELAKWQPQRVTEQYVRIGQINPDKFEKDSFRTIWIDETKGIKGIIGRLIGKDTTTIQSYLFQKEKFNKDSAKEWISKKDIVNAELIGAPYASIASLPPAVRRKLDIEGQRKFMAIFNGAWDYYSKKFDDKKKIEALAFKTAWAKSRGNGIIAKITNLFKAKQEESIEDMDKIQQADAEILNSVLLEKKTVIMEKQNQLLDKLLKERKNENIS